ncbi:MAG TPA: hypothetical protein VGS08_06370 [Candidatus Saccharimonadales bacterium]|nr:hypothetical protein [Candidatus Saccharimonadales bacterium]
MIRLGQRFVVKTFDDDPDVDVQEIRQLLDDYSNNTKEEQKC